MVVEDIQIELKRLGFNPGVVDGMWGTNTRGAVKAFQKARGLAVDGVVDPITAAALFPTLSPKTRDAIEPPWYAEGKRRMGLHEVRNKATLWAWLRSDGRELGDPSKLPWCGDYVDTCIARTLPNEPLLANPYWAQNWAKFGVALARPALGAVLAFTRNGGGHVGFCAGADATYFAVLGGNQSNAVTIARIARSRCIGIRWPKSYPLPTNFDLPTSQGAISRNEA